MKLVSKRFSNEDFMLGIALRRKRRGSPGHDCFSMRTDTDNPEIFSQYAYGKKLLHQNNSQEEIIWCVRKLISQIAGRYFL